MCKPCFRRCLNLLYNVHTVKHWLCSYPPRGPATVKSDCKLRDVVVAFKLLAYDNYYNWQGQRNTGSEYWYNLTKTTHRLNISWRRNGRSLATDLYIVKPWACDTSSILRAVSDHTDAWALLMGCCWCIYNMIVISYINAGYIIM